MQREERNPSQGKASHNGSTHVGKGMLSSTIVLRKGGPRASASKMSSFIKSSRPASKQSRGPYKQESEPFMTPMNRAINLEVIASSE